MTSTPTSLDREGIADPDDEGSDGLDTTCHPSLRLHCYSTGKARPLHVSMSTYTLLDSHQSVPHDPL